MGKRHLTIGSVIEKNRIASENAYLILMSALIKDDDGNDVSTIRFVKNSENIIFQGDTYQAANFDLNITLENNSEPSIKLSAQDQTRTLAQYIEAYSGMVGSLVTMTVINANNLPDGTPELQESFKVISASVNEYVVEFDLGTESAVNKRFPAYRQFKERCSWPYKGNRCGYVGPLGTCDYTLLGSNGCAAHNNVARFGGFPGINTQI